MKKYKPGGLVGRQGELDKNKDGKISGADFKMMGHGGKMKYMGGGKMPEYAHGGKAEAPGSVDALLELLSNYDQDSSIGDFLNILNEMYGMSPQTSAMGAGSEMGSAVGSSALQGPMTMFGSKMGAAAGEGADSVMKNLPPETLEEILRQFGSQGGKPFVSFPSEE